MKGYRRKVQGKIIAQDKEEDKKEIKEKTASNKDIIKYRKKYPEKIVKETIINTLENQNDYPLNEKMITRRKEKPSPKKNNNDENNDEDFLLMRIHKMSYRSKEMGKIRRSNTKKLVSETVNDDKKTEESNEPIIDQNRAQFFAAKYFKKRQSFLKHKNIKS